MLGRAAGALGKFGKFIPGVGTALTAGLAVKGAYDAFQDTEGTLGLEKGAKATTGQKVAAGAAGALSSLSFGLLDQKSIGGFLNKSLGLGETEKEKEERIKVEEELIETEKKKKQVLNSLIEDLRDTANPLDKFSKNIDKANKLLESKGIDATSLPPAEREALFKELGIDPAMMSQMTSRNFTTSSGGGARPAGGRAGATSTGTSSSSGGSSAAPAASRGGSSAAPAASSGGGGLVSRMIDSAASFFRDPFSGNSDKPPEKEKTAGGGSMSEQDIKNMIIDHEGIRYSPYKDSLGLWTVGVGHLIGDGKSLPASWNREFSHDEVMSIFDEDYKHHREAAEKIPGFNKLDTAGQGALTDLTFNMGPVWYRKWPRFSKAMEEGDTELAALSLEQSKWYGQVGRRAPKIVSLVENAQVSAREGGIAKGPEKGYPATLHGNEIIVPLDPNSILAELGKKSAQQAASEMNNILPESKNNQMDGMKDVLNLNQALMELLSNKLDTMINKMDTSNDTQSKLLKVSQV